MELSITLPEHLHAALVAEAVHRDMELETLIVELLQNSREPIACLRCGGWCHPGNEICDDCGLAEERQHRIWLEQFHGGNDGTI